MAFREASAISGDDGEFFVEIPDGWQQGRGAFGGLVLGAMARAMRRAEEDGERVLRSLTGELVAPVDVGEALVEVSVLRRGSSLSSLEARLSQNERVLARASAILARDRDVEPARIEPRSPDPLPRWEECDVAPVQAPLGPVFAQHYEFRPVLGFPFSGADEARVGGWVREREPPEMLDAPAIVGLLDSFWPVSLVTADRFRAGATVSFMAELLTDPSTLDPAVSLQFHSHGLAERGGYFVEQRELWHDGAPVAFNQQMFAMID